MVAPSYTDIHQQRGWFSAWLALWSLCWRLSVLLIFFMGICANILLDHWWASLACVAGFLVAAFIIRLGSTVESEKSSGDSITFL